MSVILFILKLIGIILLALLGIIAWVLLLVLFVPVHYRVSGELGDEITIHAKATWLLHLISFAIDYEAGEIANCLRIMGICRKPKEKSVVDVPLPKQEIEPEDKIQDSRIVSESETTEADEDAKTAPERESTEKLTFFEKIQRRIQAFGEIVHKLKDTASQIGRKASDIRRVITDEANQSVVQAVFSELEYLLKHFKFRKLVTDLCFSAGDPAATGQALGVLCMFPVLYQYQVSIIPDFEREELYVKGTFEIKGHMRAIHLIVTLVHLWKKREVRVLVKKLLDKQA